MFNISGIREKQSKALSRYHYIAIKMVKIKNTSAGENAEQMDPFTFLIRMQNGIATLEKQFGSFLFFFKFQHIYISIHLPKDPGISLLGIYPRKMKTYIHPKTCRHIS